MIKIFVCDDDDMIRLEIEKQINNQIIIHEYDWKIEVSCDSPIFLLEKLRVQENKGNIYFLDVDLKHSKYDGFSLGKEIREIDPNAIISYITNFGDLAFRTFQYHIEAFDYIVKSESSKLLDSLSRCLSSINQKLLNDKKDTVAYFTCKVGNVVKHLRLDDIYFFETSSKPHHIILHAKNQCIDFIGELTSVEKELKDNFLRVHRSYLVALDKIEEIDLKKNQLMINGQICDISRKAKAILLKKVQ